MLNYQVRIGLAPMRRDVTPRPGIFNEGELMEKWNTQQTVMRKDPEFSHLSAIPSPRITLETLLSAAEDGCTGCRALLTRAGKAVGAALSAAIMIVNPQDIILNGTICASPFFEDSVRRTLAKRCIPESLDGVQLRMIASDPRQDATGAAMIPYHFQFSVSEGPDES